jgi:uncharacterized cupredoxin-like copper-binding protein
MADERGGRGMRRILVLLAVLTLGFTAGACGGTGTTSTPSPTDSDETSVDTVEKDFSIAVSPTSSSTRRVTFKITNQGPTAHEFVVFKTDLDPASLPLSADGTAVNEDGAGVTHIDEKEDIAKDATATLSLTLQPGKYVLICNLPTHYKLGMRAPFIVSS